jgi:hypothetical protein
MTMGSMPGTSSSLLGPTMSVADQVAGESEQQRKKRLQSLQASQTQAGASALLGASYGAALGA